MKRNGHRLRSKKGKKYAYDRKMFTMYLNFTDMYEFVYEAMVTGGIAVKWDEPMWMDQEGNEVQLEEDVFGMKVTIKVIWPDLGFIH